MIVIAIAVIAMIGVMVPSVFAVENEIKVEPNLKSKIEIKVTDFRIERLSEHSKYGLIIEYQIFNVNPSTVRIHNLSNQIFEINSSNSKFVCEDHPTGSRNFFLDSNDHLNWSTGGCTITFKELYDNHPEVWYSLEENTSTWKVLGNLKYDQFNPWDPDTTTAFDYPFEFLLTGPIPTNFPPLTSEIKVETEYLEKTELDSNNIESCGFLIFIVIPIIFLVILILILIKFGLIAIIPGAPILGVIWFILYLTMFLTC